MEKILVSACLLGENVRYNAEIVEITDNIRGLYDRYEVIPVCPEVLGGLDVPREACEIVGDGGGSGVLDGDAVVIGAKGTDCTGAFIIGAKAAVALAKGNNVAFAVLKQRSPSCGNGTIYTGNFDGTRKQGDGVTSALLKRYNIKVISEEDI